MRERGKKSWHPSTVNSSPPSLHLDDCYSFSRFINVVSPHLTLINMPSLAQGFTHLLFSWIKMLLRWQIVPLRSSLKMQESTQIIEKSNMRHAGSFDGLVATASLTHFQYQTNIVKVSQQKMRSSQIGFLHKMTRHSFLHS